MILLLLDIWGELIEFIVSKCNSCIIIIVLIKTDQVTIYFFSIT